MVREYKDVHSISVRRIWATKDAADYYGVRPRTILDKYARQLGISAHEFDDLL